MVCGLVTPRFADPSGSSGIASFHPVRTRYETRCSVMRGTEPLELACALQRADVDRVEPTVRTDAASEMRIVVVTGDEHSRDGPTRRHERAGEVVERLTIAQRRGAPREVLGGDVPGSSQSVEAVVERGRDVDDDSARRAPAERRPSRGGAVPAREDHDVARATASAARRARTAFAVAFNSGRRLGSRVQSWIAMWRRRGKAGTMPRPMCRRRCEHVM